MKRTFGLLTLIAIIALILNSSAMTQMEHEQHHHEMMTTEKDEVVCPVTNKVMKKAEASASYTLYFASEAAKDAFIKDPAKFLTTTCPVMGGQVNKLTASYSNYEGVAYYFCCDGCQEKFEKEPKTYIGKVPMKSEASGSSGSSVMGGKTSGHTCGASAAAGQSYEAARASCSATCPAMKAKTNLVSDPVCGMQFSTEDGMKVTHEGTEYFFCSEQCKVKFEKNPEKYDKK